MCVYVEQVQCQISNIVTVKIQDTDAQLLIVENPLNEMNNEIML